MKLGNKHLHIYFSDELVNVFKIMVEKINKYLPFVAMALFCYLTLKNGVFSGRPCLEDEAHAWTIAAHVNIIQLIDLMKVEGHFLIWYLCLMPFAKLNIAFPYPMLFLNWIFCVAALSIMWWKAPFNNFLKLFITFSAPILAIYAIHARCYSIGFLFIFLALSFYKERISHPYRYLTFLVLAANTNITMCVLSGVLGMIFVYDLIKNKTDRKVLDIIFTVVLLQLILLYFQFHGTHIPDYNDWGIGMIKMPYFMKVFLGIEDFRVSAYLFKVILLRIAVVLFPVLLFKSKRAFIFYICTVSIMLLFFSFVYTATFYHINLFYIISIVAYWIYQMEGVKDKRNNILIAVLFTLVSFGLIFVSLETDKGYLLGSRIILRDKNLNSAKLYTSIPPITFSVNLPILENKNIYIYDLLGRNISYYEGLKTYYNEALKFPDFDVMAESLDKKKDNYMILHFPLPNDFVRGLKYRMITQKYNEYTYRQHYKIYIYKIKDVVSAD